MNPALAINGGKAVRTAAWPAWPQYGAAEEAAVLRVVRSGNAHPMFGPETKILEQAFADYQGGGHAVALGSGTAALQATMAAAGVGVGHEVICPAYTYAASASAAVEQNAVPVFVDSEPMSQGAAPADIEAKITSATKAIVLVHVNGYPCDIDPVMEMARSRGIAVIEDCSHAHGATHRGRKVGTIGDFGAFSIQQKKNLSAGMGGIAYTKDPEAAEEMRKIRNFEWHSVGHNWQINEFSSAIATLQLAKLDEMNAIRRRNAKLLTELIADVPGLTPLPGLPGTDPVYYNVILQYDEALLEVSRARFVEAVAAEGLPIKMFYQPLQRWPIFREANFYGKGYPFANPLLPNGPASYRDVRTPVAEAICDHVNLEIKVQPVASEDDIRDAAAALRKVVEHREELLPVHA